MTINFSNLSYFLAKQIFANKQLWLSIGDIESKCVNNKVDHKTVFQPVYITGLARSGTTLMLENLAKIKGCTSHTYRDFPMIYTPYVWNKLLSICDKFAFKNKASERSHQDGMKVTPESPEALEEIIWESFFNNLHNESEISVLSKNRVNEKFNAFYQRHIQKLLVVRSAKRYLAKANYNITRLEYLLDLNDSSKFIIMVRNPVMHIKSILRQDKIFSETHNQYPKTLKFMEMSGHYEFGINKKLINVDADDLKLIKQKFNNKDDISAWALYWNMMYKYVISLAESLPRDNFMLCRYEDLCNNPRKTLDKIFDFTDLLPTKTQGQEIINSIKPLATKHDFTSKELALIKKITGNTARYFGY
ncbi:MAG: sulfotransferase [Rickettsiales bacterium]|nr:sulfotransferase [Rickettsiales bacterium]